MRNTIHIDKREIEEESFLYRIDNHVFKIYKLKYSTQPMYPWRLEYNQNLAATLFSNQHGAEGTMREILSQKEPYKNAIFTFDANLKTKNSNCECGKEKHNFFSHSFWCPKY